MKNNKHPRATSKQRFSASVGSGVLELTMYDDIGENWWSGGGITAKWVKAKMETAGPYSSILIHLDSPGGDAFEGATIYNVLRQQKKPVNVVIDGLAASAASVIAMAGDTITMGPGTMMMVHNASGICIGESKDMLKTAEVLDKVSQSLGEIYVARTGKTADEVKAIMDAETWMRAQECVDLGFATSVSAAVTREEAPLATAKASRFLNSYKNLPAELKADEGNRNGCECDCENCVAGDCSDCTNRDCEDADCKDCPMQEDGDMGNRTRLTIQNLFAIAETGWSDQVSSNKADILAVRKTGTAILNLAPSPTESTSIGKISGILAPYDSASRDLGGFQEIYQKGCFADSAASSDDKQFNVNHNPDMLLGCTAAKTAKVWEESDGLHYEIDLPNTQAARDLRISMERKDIRGASAAFYIQKHRWENRGGIRTRIIEKAQLVEGSPTGCAAYESTTAAQVEDDLAIGAVNELELIGARLRLLNVA